MLTYALKVDPTLNRTKVNFKNIFLLIQRNSESVKQKIQKVLLIQKVF
jgi:hypothetical protein